jgi:hypothetical protein
MLHAWRIDLRIAAMLLFFTGPLWLLFSLPILITDQLGWWRPLTVTAPPFAFAAMAGICAHRNTLGGARRVLTLAAIYVELAVFGLFLGIGVNAINGQGWGA